MDRQQPSLPRVFCWDKDQWVAYLRPLIDAMTDRSDENYTKVLCRTWGLSVEHHRDMFFIEAWIELKQPFVEKMTEWWGMQNCKALMNFDGVGYPEEQAKQMFYLICESKAYMHICMIRNNNRFFGNMLKHLPEEMKNLPKKVTLEISDLLATGVKANDVASLKEKLDASMKDKEKNENTRDRLMTENRDLAKKVMETNAFQKSSDEHKQRLVTECERLKKNLIDTLEELKKAQVKIELLKEINAAPKTAATTTVPPPPTTNHPPDTDVSWNMLYNSSRDRAHQRPVNDNHYFHDTSNGHRHGKHDQRPQGTGPQKRYRDNGYDQYNNNGYHQGHKNIGGRGAEHADYRK